jgi:VWFA-related protein
LRLIPSLALCAAVTVSSFAQEQQPSRPPDTLTTAADYVEVPVIVQRGNKPVSGLAKADFTVQQDGKDQPIAKFEEVRTTTSAVTMHDPTGFSNTYLSGKTLPQVVILAMDTVDTPALDQAYFGEELKKYVAELKPGDPPMGLIELTRTGIKVRQDFTYDRQSLLAEMKKMSDLPSTNNERSQALAELYNEVQQMRATYGGGFDGVLAKELEDATIQADKTEELMSHFQDTTARIDSLNALQQLAQALKGIPGRKTLVWAGTGFPFMSVVVNNGKAGYTYSSIDRIGSTLDSYAYTWKLLNDANVAVYPIDLRRTSNPAFAVMDTTYKNSPTPQQKDQSFENDSQVTATFQQLAGQTGGKPCIFRTDLHNCLREASDDNKDYYLLGFYMDKTNKAAGYHKINVKLKGQKATLRYREGFLVAPPKTAGARANDIQLALESPFAYTSLPFSGRFVGFTPQGDKQAVNFELRIPPDAISLADSKINFDILAVVRAPGGKEAARISQHIERSLQSDNILTIQAQGIDYTNKLTVPAGDYGVWFVLRDNPTGRTGSVTVPLKVQ